MEETVKPGVRAEHAALTRARILDAARAEFEERGFAGTPITGIATRAGVAVPTIYKVFMNKRTLLAQVVDRAMTGAEYGGRVDEQTWWQEQLNEPDPERQLALIARNARRIYERAGQVLEVVRAAAALDPEIGEMWKRVMEQRVARSRRTASRLVSRTGGRARFGAPETAVTLLALTAPELYTAQIEAGRTPAQYERWLGAVLTASLLR
ncbi:MAG TPA: helix-turn-helix domain-containing protein [Dehalococcoidia bacterium]|jgi:AcrR family transcriptional regulator|nr:helix-turn-helix domain-containing protein [Dehalococcoidia bacterium]